MQNPHASCVKIVHDRSSDISVSETFELVRVTPITVLLKSTTEMIDVTTKYN